MSAAARGLGKGDIGVFDSHEGSVGVEFLAAEDGEHVGTAADAFATGVGSAAATTAAAAVNITRALGGNLKGECKTNITRPGGLPLLSAGQRATLIAAVDTAQNCAIVHTQHGPVAAAAAADFKLALTNAELADLIGAPTVGLLAGLMGSEHTEVVVRRSEPQGKLINFHTDVGLRTLQVALNDGYVGGKLVFCTPEGVRYPDRPAGTATLHGGKVAHGVTAHTAGVRYGLFLLKTLPQMPRVGVRSPEVLVEVT
jgi:hypothetical protein